jgi:small multidrug resistance pump
MKSVDKNRIKNMNSSVIALLIGFTVLFNTVAQTLLKLGSGQSPLNLYLVGGLGAYGLSTAFYIAILGKLNLSFIYPVVIGLTVVASILSGCFLLKEKVSMVQALGIALMIGGLIIVSSSKA